MPTRNRDADPDSQRRIVRALRQLTQKLDAHSRRLLTHYDVTMPQVICMDELNEKGAMTVTVLADNMHVNPSTAVGVIDRLEKKQFVKRTRSTADRRSVLVEITDAGREFIISAPYLLHNRLHQNLHTLERTAKNRIADALDDLLQLLND